MSRLNRLAINDEGFIFDPETGNSFTVNGTGLFIIKLLKEFTDDFVTDMSEFQKVVMKGENF